MPLHSLENEASLGGDDAASETAAKAPQHQEPQREQPIDNDTNTNCFRPGPTRTFPFVRPNVRKEICQQVVRCKLAKRRHLVLNKAFDPQYLEDHLFPTLLERFAPQHVTYNGGVANVKNWKISCYLEVMEGGVPTTEPNEALLDLFSPLLDACNDLFLYWYRQQHACNAGTTKFGVIKKEAKRCRRLMTFITRYTPAPGEQALLKHVDGAGKVDGSCVVALPMEKDKEFAGGGLTFWDGKTTTTTRTKNQPDEIHYDTRAGDLAFIDRYVR